MKKVHEVLPFHWKVRRDAQGRKQPILDLESLRQLFDRLGEVDAGTAGAAADGVAEAAAEAAADEVAEAAAEAAADEVAEAAAEETRAGLRYLVALLLLRKRRLKLVDAQTPEQERADLVVVDPKIEGMEPVALLAPELDPDRLGNLREELMAAIGEESTSPGESES